MQEIILEFLKNNANLKNVAWVFIIVVLLLIIFYPIIDTNLLYYSRVSNRVDILERVSRLDENEIRKNENLEKEYNSIIKEMSEKENNYLNNIFIKETSLSNNIIKFVAAAWLFIIIGIVIPFTKDKKTGKRSRKNLSGGILCVIFGIFIGYIGYLIPIIVNITINIILYQCIIIYLAYTISKYGNNISNNNWSNE